MAAVSKSVVFMRGKVYWCKILGKPRPNYGGDANEWTFEFEPDEDANKEIRKHKLGDRIKNKYEDRGGYLTLKKSELSRDGSPNTPIRVYNADNEEWDSSDLIGNGSVVDVKLDIRDYGPGKKKGVYPVAVRVIDLVPYKSSEFGDFGKPKGETEDDEDTPAPKGKKDTFREDFGLDDEIPV